MALPARTSQIVGIARRLAALEPFGRSAVASTGPSELGPLSSDRPQNWGSSSHSFASLDGQKDHSARGLWLSRLQPSIVGSSIITQIPAPYCLLAQPGLHGHQVEVWKELLRHRGPVGDGPDGIIPLRADSVKRKRKRKMNKHKQRKRRRRDRKLKK